MPPRVASAVPIITMREGARAMSGLSNGTEVAADIQVLHQHPRLAPRRARDAFDLGDLDLATTLGLALHGVGDALAIARGKRRLAHHLQHHLAGPLLLVLDRVH